MIHLWRLAALLLLLISSTACGPFRKSKTVPPPAVFTPPPPQPAPPAPEPLPAPPGVEPAAGTGLPKVAAPPIAQPAKPAPARRSRTARRPAPTQPQPQPVAATPEPTPHLTQLLTPAEQQSYNAAIDVALQRTQQNLARASGRKLTPEQTLNMTRITNFVQQAHQARPTDLVTARSLAQRAEVLAQDLVNSLR